MSSVWSLPALLARLSFSDAAALHSALLDLSREAFFGDDPLPLPSLEQFTHFLSALSYLYPLYLPDPPIRSTALLLFLLLLGLRSIQPPPLCFGSEHEDVAFLDFVRVQRLLQLRELSDDLRHSPRRCLRLLCLAAHLFRYRSDQSTGQDTGRSEKERLINVRVVSLDKVEVDKSCLSTSAGRSAPPLRIPHHNTPQHTSLSTTDRLSACDCCIVVRLHIRLPPRFRGYRPSHRPSAVDPRPK